MSSCWVAIRAASNEVGTPIQRTTVSAVGEGWNRKKERASMKTPAATIVAAWIRAETGVGPSMASGSQTWSGNWADFPIAPQKISRAAAVMKPGLKPRVDQCWLRSSKETVPEADQTNKIPSMNPKSPMRLARKALLAASGGAGLKNQ